MLDKEFVPYQEALELKELGFDEPCYNYYDDDNEEQIIKLFPYLSSFGIKQSERILNQGFENTISAPLYQQAFRWFRKKYGLVIQYIPFELDNEEGQSILHHKHKISEYDSWRGGRRNTIETELCDDYEEAELACLRKLIEIVKK